VTLAPKGLLIEESRTNLFLQSESFTSPWSVAFSNASVGSVTDTSPAGASTVATLVEDSETGVHAISQPVVLTNTAYTMSVYAKAGSRNWIYFRMRDSTNTSRYVWFNLSTGSVGNAQTGITSSMSAVNNGFYRCVATIADAYNASTVYQIGLATGDNNASYAGNGTGYVAIWGPQLELGAFATSYIPSVASQVTRAADNASMIGNNFARWYNASEGTVYAEAFVRGQPVNNNFHLCTLFSNSTNFMSLRVNNNTIRILATGISGNVGQWSMNNNVNVSVGQFSKATFAYKTNDIALSVNGGAIASDSNAVIPVVNNLQLGADFANAQPLNGTIKRISYYNRRLANTELQGITA
jgi:hypothetical protein